MDRSDAGDWRDAAELSLFWGARYAPERFGADDVEGLSNMLGGDARFNLSDSLDRGLSASVRHDLGARDRVRGRAQYRHHAPCQWLAERRLQRHRLRRPRPRLRRSAIHEERTLRDDAHQARPTDAFGPAVAQRRGGGGGRQVAGGAGAATGYRTADTVATDGSKGEGIAGKQRYVAGRTAIVDNAQGYPAGSAARTATRP